MTRGHLRRLTEGVYHNAELYGVLRKNRPTRSFIYQLYGPGAFGVASPLLITFLILLNFVDTPIYMWNVRNDSVRMNFPFAVNTRLSLTHCASNDIIFGAKRPCYWRVTNDDSYERAANGAAKFDLIFRAEGGERETKSDNRFLTY